MLLDVNNVSIGFADTKPMQMVVNNISFQVDQGEILGIVGESGSGKSMTALSIMGLHKDTARITSGEIIVEGNNLLSMSEKQKRSYLGDQVSEMLAIHTRLSRKEQKEKTLEALLEVGLNNPGELYNKYPHELSGGMRQRVMIAMAMICKPKILIADEPTTALDVSVQAQILALLKKINKEHGVSIILISHDLGVIRTMCERTIVMSQGKIVEQGLVEDIFRNPKQEYTKKLIDAVPSIHKKKVEIDTVVQSHSKVNGQVSKMLSVNGVNIYYYQNGRIRRGVKKQIVKQVSFHINEGEVVGIVGESGSGKSTLAKAIAGLNMFYEGEITCTETRPQMVFQDPYSSLNQAKNVQWILEEPLKIKGGYTKEERRRLVKEKLREVGLLEEVGNRYVYQLSGGQRQRVCIAAALMLQSKFVVLDEAVSALDVTIQRQILDLLMELKEKHCLTYLFISHDMNVIHEICDRVIVMNEGKIVEQGDTVEVFRAPKDEYTKKLLAAIL